MIPVNLLCLLLGVKKADEYAVDARMMLNAAETNLILIVTNYITYLVPVVHNTL